MAGKAGLEGLNESMKEIGESEIDVRRRERIEGRDLALVVNREGAEDVRSA